jgi:hypothetical protein
MAKFNVKFSESVYRLLAGIALDREQTMADVVRDEISRSAWLDDELRQGHTILIDRHDGKVVELAFSHQGRLNPAGRPMPPETVPAQAPETVPEPEPKPMAAQKPPQVAASSNVRSWDSNSPQPAQRYQREAAKATG